MTDKARSKIRGNVVMVINSDNTISHSGKRGWVLNEVVGIVRAHSRGIQVPVDDNGAMLDVTLESAYPITDEEVLLWKIGHFEGTNTVESETVGIVTSPATGKRGIMLPGARRVDLRYSNTPDLKGTP